MLNETTDEELMIAYQLGEADAFAELYSRHAPRVLSFLRKKVQNEAMARDVFQSTFLKLHSCRARYDVTFPFAPWLFTICRSELLDALKRPSNKQEIPVAELPECPALEPESFVELNLAPLPAAQKKAIELRYNQEFSFEEIARRLETSPANVRQLVSRAIRSLRGLHGKQ